MRAAVGSWPFEPQNTTHPRIRSLALLGLSYRTCLSTCPLHSTGTRTHLPRFVLCISPHILPSWISQLHPSIRLHRKHYQFYPLMRSKQAVITSPIFQLVRISFWDITLAMLFWWSHNTLWWYRWLNCTFTHITIRYSDLSSFPCLSCQTRQETSAKEGKHFGGFSARTLTCPQFSCFGPYLWIGGPIVSGSRCVAWCWLVYTTLYRCQHLFTNFPEVSKCLLSYQ